MDTKEVVLLRSYQSNNPGEMVSFEGPRADRLVADNIARWPTDEEIHKVLHTHDKHKTMIENEGRGQTGTVRKVILPSERRAAEKVEKDSAAKTAKKE